MVELTKAQTEFLSLLGDVPKTRRDLPLADRDQDKVRQSCKRRGFAEFVGGYMNGMRAPMGWRITDAGRAALNQSEGKS